MSDPLIERLEMLKANLETLEARGADAAELFDLRSRIARLSVALIVSDLRDEDEAYEHATHELEGAIEVIRASKEDIASVTSAVRTAAAGVAVVERALRLIT
jgi:hypothetical protein